MKKIELTINGIAKSYDMRQVKTLFMTDDSLVKSAPEYIKRRNMRIEKRAEMFDAKSRECAGRAASLRKKKTFGPALSVSWAADYPLFSLEVDKNAYRLVDETGYDHGKDSIGKQVELFNLFNQRNIQEGGVAVKCVAVVICENGDEQPDDTWTNGWVPVQNARKVFANNKLAYCIEYVDGTNSGWLRWYACIDAGDPLTSLAVNSVARGFARAAREQCIKTRGQL
ncbi:MAG: hypothetical protein LBK26_03000 [Rickettsiales bacterium]|nr:hypothetical protein [Rickettsiales bacterium]